MTSCKLILRNVRKNMRDHLIYFLTLMISVSMFYAFNSLSDQTAFSDLSATKVLLYEQLDRLMGLLSVVIAVVLAFLIVYADRFLLKRRKKELGIYMMSGMKKGRISRLFAAETLCVGLFSLAAGLILGLFLSQGVSMLSIRLFAADLSDYRLVLSGKALIQTTVCFGIIFFLVTVFNVRTVSSVKLIDLLSAERKNETSEKWSPALMAIVFLLSIVALSVSCAMFLKNGILPSRKDLDFQTASVLLVIGLLLFFYSVANVILRALQTNRSFYLRGLNTFLVRQISGKIRTDHLILSIICGLLTVTICALSVGTATALAMNELAQASAPYDLNVLSQVDIDGDTDIAGYLRTQGIEIDDHAEQASQISIRQADLTYGELFEGQDLNLWAIDRPVPSSPVFVLSLSDFNRALSMQGKEPYHLKGNEFLLNCNYEGTMEYVKAALERSPSLTIAGVELKRASDTVLTETWYMTSVGNNDRGTLILPDHIAEKLAKEMNVLLVQYKDGADSAGLLEKLLPIGLDDTHGYRYAEKEMMYDAYFGSNALIVFLCLYLGVTFLLICAALLALKQLTETADSFRRFRLLQKLGASRRQVSRTLFWQTAVFFLVPLALAGILSSVFLRKAMETVEEFMNMHISTNVLFTAVLFLIIYGVYFLATYLSCRRIVLEQRKDPQKKYPS